MLPVFFSHRKNSTHTRVKGSLLWGDVIIRLGTKEATLNRSAAITMTLPRGKEVPGYNVTIVNTSTPLRSETSG